MEHPIGVDGVARMRVLDLPVDDVPEQCIADALSNMLSDGETHHIVLLSLWDFMRARRDSELRKLVANASLVIPTTVGLVRGAAFLRQGRPTRYTHFDFVVRLLGALERTGGTLYLVGGSRDELRIVEGNIRQTFPGVRLVGRYFGDYPRAMETDIVTAIRKAAPDVLFAGPRLVGGEKWLWRRRSSFAPGVSIFSDECYEVFAERRRRPTRSATKQALLRALRALWHPWRVFALFVYGWYWVRLFFRRLR